MASTYEKIMRKVNETTTISPGEQTRGYSSTYDRIMQKANGESQMTFAPNPPTFSRKLPEYTASASNINFSNDKSQKQAENYARMQDLASRLSETPASGQSAIPQQMDTGESANSLRDRLNNSKVLNFAQNLLEASNPLKGGANTLSYLSNQATARANSEADAMKRLEELQKQAMTDKSVLNSKEYRDALMVASGADLLGIGLKNAGLPEQDNTFKNVSNAINTQSQKATNELLEGKTGLSRDLTQGAISGLDMLGTAGVASMSGLPFLGVMAAQSGAQTGQQALDNGERYDKAALAAAGSGAITAGIESMGGIAGSWGGKAEQALAKTAIGKKVLSAVPKAVADKIAALAATKLGGVLGDAASEGAEEFAEYYAQGFFNNLLLDNKTPLDVREALENAKIGALVGGAFGGGRVIGSTANDMLSGLENKPGKATQSAPPAANATQQTAPMQGQPELLGLPEQATRPTLYADESGNITKELPNQMPEDVRFNSPRQITQTTFDSLLGENVQTGHLDAGTINTVLSEAYFAKTSPVTYAKSKVDALMPQINDALNQVKEAYAGFNGNGVDMVRMYGDTGETGTFKRVSNNPQWYRDLYANGTAPTKAQKTASAVSAFWDDVQKERGEFLPVEIEQAYNKYNAVLKAGNAINDNTIMVTPDGSQAIDMDKSPAPVYSPVQGRQALAAVDALFQEQAAQKAQMGDRMVADLDMGQNSVQQDTRHILEKLKENISSMQGVEAVATLSGNEFSKGNKKLTETVGDFFRSIGNKVFRNGVGDVILDENGIKSDIAHGIGRAKAVTFAAVPDVIAKGKQIDYQQDWKGRGYDTLVFSAPVKIGNQISYVAAVVRKAKNSNRFYLHEVLDENGNILYIKKEPNSFKTGPSAKNSATGELDPFLNTNIAQAANGVNNIISDSNAKNAKEADYQKLYAVAPEMRSMLAGKNHIHDYFTPHEGLEGNREYLNVPSLTERIGEGERAFDGVKTLLAAAKQERSIREGEAVAPGTAEVLTERERKTARETITDTGESLYRGAIDEGYNIGKVANAVGDDVLYAMYNNAKSSHAAAQYMIGEAQTDINGREVGQSLVDIFAPAKSKGKDYFKQFQEYLYHMHNIDRMSLETAGKNVYLDMIEAIENRYPGISQAEQWRKLAAEGNEDASRWLKLNADMDKLKNKPVYGPEVSAQDSLNEVSSMILQHPEFEDMADAVYNYNRNLMKMRVDSGLLSQAQAELFERLYPHYVPAFRVGDSTYLHEDNFRRADVSQTVKRATGGTEKLQPIDDSMAIQTMQVVSNANRNLFGNRLLEDAAKSRDKVGRDVQIIEDLDMGAESQEDPANLQNVFMVYVAGKPVKMALSNGMMEGVRGIMPKQSDVNALLKGYFTAYNTFKASVTGYNPAFVVKNGVRDIQDAGLYSQDFTALLKNYPRAWDEMRSNGALWRLYLSKGGVGNSVFDYEKGFKDLTKQKNVAEKALDKVEQANLMVEQAPRFAEFLSVIDKGGTSYENVQKALLAAADVTVNFGRSGSWGKIVNRGIVPFFNPAMQGVDKTVRTAIKAYRNKDMIRLVGKVAVLGVLQQVFNALMYRDDDEYDMINNRDKDNYYLIKIKDGLWVKLPKGRVLSMFGNVAQRALRQMNGESAEDAWAGIIRTTVDNIAPENPLARNFVTPLFEANLLDSDSPGKTWYKTDIEPQRLRKFAPGERYDETTDAISKAVGGALNVSPKKINYVLDQYSGVVGDMLLPLMTPKAEKSIFENSFLIDPVLNNKLSEKFYDTYNNAQYAYYSKEVTPGDTAVYKELGSVSSALSDMYSEIRDIENSDMPDKEKQSEVRALREQINSLLSDAMDSVDEIRKTADNDFADIPQEVYYNAMVATRKTQSDKDKDGDTVYLSASKNKKAAIDEVAKGLTTEQKRKLYKAFGISEKVW